jgi:sortase (surface protein transpeptidase)
MSSRPPTRRADRSQPPPDEGVPARDDTGRSKSGRGPLALFTAGAVVAAVIAAAQLMPAGTPGFRHIQGFDSLPGVGDAASNAPPARGAADGSGVVVNSLEELRSNYGDPSDATYGRMRIPSINVDAPLGKRTVKDGQLPDPSGPGDVVWYDFGRNSALGGVPGAGANAVFAGHVDRNGPVEYAGVDYNGPGVFFLLNRLNEGDTIEVTAGGKTWRYAVIWLREVAVDDDWDILFSAKVLGDTITLVTCAGPFDYDRDEYPSRLVVRAVRG